MISYAFIAAGALGVWLLVGPDGGMAASIRRMLGAARRPPSTAPAERMHSALAGAAAGAAGWVGAWALFGGALVPPLVALLGAVIPPCAAARRRRERMAGAWQAWPRLLAEIRVLVAHRGQSIPSALFAVGAHAPPQMRRAFSEASRTWSLGTDFGAALGVLKSALADPTADAVCETLLAAHQIGGVRVELRLRALAEAAQAEAAARSDALAKQAGARFARSFVALVPAFMAMIGLSIGRGREAYQASGGQLLAAFSVAAVAGCWLWAGRIMAVPLRKRVFVQ